MLYWSLALSFVLWMLGLLALRRPGWWTVLFFGWGIVFSLGVLLPAFFLPVAILFVLLTVLICVRPLLVGHRNLAFSLSFGAFLTAFGVGTFYALDDAKDYARLREKYPMESMEQRLPEPRHNIPHFPLPDEATKRLDRLEIDVSTGNIREYTLQVLHERQVRDFTDAPGFGVARMMRPREEYLKIRRRSEEPIPQPAPVRASAGVEEKTPWEPKRPESDLYDLHREGVVDFANADGFGYVKDRSHVAGFISHRFSEVPRPRAGWSVGAVELVGLLLHPEPVAYISDQLPQMEDLRHAPTRKLDDFELKGLESLVRGEDLYAGNTATGLRMLGAVRATKQCVQCHACERGELLGAFSYWMFAKGEAATRR